MSKSQPIALRTAALALAALVAFSANSILARLALGAGLVDAASYGAIRIVAGAAMLLLLTRLRSGAYRQGSWTSGALLALYAAPFAFAYLELSAGTGALVLFGAVQASMFVAGLRGGERPGVVEWAGVTLAVAGLVWFVLPGVDRAPLLGTLLMAVAGVAWGGYSLRGRRAGRPLFDTTGNFVRAVPFMAAVLLVRLPFLDVTAEGTWYAVLSGAVASALGYAVWYAALAGLTAIRAATLQLSVPVLTAWAGVWLLDERITTRLALAGSAVVAGVALAVFGRSRPA